MNKATIIMIVVLTAGCSPIMAAKQPLKKDLNVMNQGMPRNSVLAELGQPISSETKNGKRVEVYSFVQGYSRGAKTMRVIFHTLADVFTLGLWEIIGTPTEASFAGNKISYEITYNENDRVEKMVKL